MEETQGRQRLWPCRRGAERDRELLAGPNWLSSGFVAWPDRIWRESERVSIWKKPEREENRDVEERRGEGGR